MEDQGYKNLLADIEDLRKRTEAKEFDDFDSTHALPKIALTIALKEMINKTKAGHYDNI